MGNLDFSLEPKFAWYVVFLALSGIVLIVLGPLAGKTQKASARLITLIIGIGFLGYAIYLTWIWDGAGTYQMFYIAFVLPIVVGFKFIGGMIAAAQAKRTSAPAPAPQPMIPPTAASATPAPVVEQTEAPTPPPAAPTPPPAN